MFHTLLNRLASAPTQSTSQPALIVRGVTSAKSLPTVSHLSVPTLPSWPCSDRPRWRSWRRRRWQRGWASPLSCSARSTLPATTPPSCGPGWLRTPLTSTLWAIRAEEQGNPLWSKRMEAHKCSASWLSLKLRKKTSQRLDALLKTSWGVTWRWWSWRTWTTPSPGLSSSPPLTSCSWWPSSLLSCCTGTKRNWPVLPNETSLKENRRSQLYVTMRECLKEKEDFPLSQEELGRQSDSSTPRPQAHGTFLKMRWSSI